MPMGVFAGLIVPSVVLHQGAHRFDLYLPAALLSVGVAWFTKKTALEHGCGGCPPGNPEGIFRRVKFPQLTE